MKAEQTELLRRMATHGEKAVRIRRTEYEAAAALVDSGHIEPNSSATHAWLTAKGRAACS